MVQNKPNGYYFSSEETNLQNGISIKAAKIKQKFLDSIS